MDMILGFTDLLVDCISNILGVAHAQEDLSNETQGIKSCIGTSPTDQLLVPVASITSS
jgi:hypothetical protein